MDKTSAETVIRSLAKQDTAGEVDDSYARTGDAQDTIERWYGAARQAGDAGVIEAIDVLGMTEAARLYEAARPGRAHAVACNRRRDEARFDPEQMCEVCGREVARFKAPNGQLTCETDYAGICALNQALRESGLL